MATPIDEVAKEIDKQMNNIIDKVFAKSQGCCRTIPWRTAACDRRPDGQSAGHCFWIHQEQASSQMDSRLNGGYIRDNGIGLLLRL